MMKTLIEQIQKGERLSTEFKILFQKEMVEECDLIEKYSSGINRIKKLCKAHGIKEPVFGERLGSTKSGYWKDRDDE